MKMVKSLLLGSAAGLVAIAGAQAADLPVKAKAVEYVKVCSAYGAGFYYIPGTDICLRVGGYVFIEAGYNARAGDVNIYNYTNGSAASVFGLPTYDRDDNVNAFRARGDVILDARSQTAIGTVRTYISFGADYNSSLAGASPPGNVTPYLERAFIQFAGFTVGQAASFFDFGAFYSIYALSSIAWNWTPVFAYTAQFGNGLSGTISIEDAQSIRTKITHEAFGGRQLAFNPPPVSAATFGPGASAWNGYGGQEFPDIVGNFRVDQAWGSAQVSGALHQLRVNNAMANPAAGFVSVSDAWGWAILGGIEIKTPMIAPGDSIMLQAAYAKGAVEYTGLSASPLASAGGIGLVTGTTTGNRVGPTVDIYDAWSGCGAFSAASGQCSGATTQLYLSTAWSANLMFRHFWQPNLRSAFWVGYNKYEPGSNNFLAGLDPELRLWQVGGNIIWSPAPTLDLSLDVLYTNVANSTCANAATVAPFPLTTTSYCDRQADIWSVWTRWRRNF